MTPTTLPLQLALTKDEQAALLALAQRAGFATIEGYLRDQLQTQPNGVSTSELSAEAPLEDTPDEHILDMVEQSFRAVLRGEKGRPVREMLAELRADNER